MRVEIYDSKIIKPYTPKVKNGWYVLTAEKKQRTSGQNKYFHGYLFPQAAIAMSKKIGKTVSMDLAKAVLKSTCGVFYVPEIEEWVVIPTSKMNRKQATIFIDKSLKYVAEKTGEYLEEPNEEQWRQIKETK